MDHSTDVHEGPNDSSCPELIQPRDCCLEIVFSCAVVNIVYGWSSNYTGLISIMLHLQYI